MQKITTFLWFNGQGEEAARFYASIFKGSKIGKLSRYGDEFPQMKGKVMTVPFTVLGHKFVALNGDAPFKFTPAISFAVMCKTQKEVDHYWKRLTSGGGQEVQCGWLADKYGVSWQIVPEILLKLIADKNKTKASRAMQAMLKMKKLDIAELKRAHAGK